MFSEYIVGEERTGYFAFLWFVVSVMSVLVCFLLLLVSLVGYARGMRIFLDIFFTINRNINKSKP